MGVSYGVKELLSPCGPIFNCVPRNRMLVLVNARLCRGYGDLPPDQLVFMIHRIAAPEPG